MAVTFQQVVESVKTARATFDAARDQAHVTAGIDDKVQAERERLSVEGIFTGSEANLEKYRQTLRSRADVHALTAATELEIAHQAGVEVVKAVRASFETLKLPSRAYRGTDEGVRAMLRAADALETHTSYTRFQGADLSAVLDAYERAKDDTDPVFVALVEQGLEDGFRAFPVTPNPDRDTSTLLRLKQVIIDRRAARVPAEVLEAEPRTRRADVTRN
jgi:hypothetical protein